MPTITRIRKSLSALGALATIAILLAGVPVFLWRTVGRPLPTQLPSWDQFTSALTHTEIPMGVLTKTLACFGWIAWLLIAVSITAELVAWFAGTTARQMRFAGPFQPLARSLVTSAAVLITFNPLSSSSFAAASLPTNLAFAQTPSAASATPHRVIEPLQADQIRITSAARTAVGAAPTGSPARMKQQTVQRHDTLWDLAERHLGDPYRWNEIWDLNCGNVQADGAVFTDAHWIRPGWVLVMPSDATGVASVAATTAEYPDTTAAPERPTPAPSSDAPSVENVPSTTEAPVVETAAVATTMPTSTTRPDVAPTPTRPMDDGDPIPPTSVPRSEAGTVNGHATQPNAESAARFPTRVPWVAGGLSAAGLVALLDQLRRAQRRRRNPGDPLHNPPADLAPVETGLRRSAASSEDRCQLLDAAMRAFAAGALGQPAMRTPRLLAVRSYADSVEVLLDEPLEGSVLGFTAQSGNRLWVTEPGMTAELLLRLADEVAAPYPALVTLGEVDGGDLLVDIETAGVLGIHAAHDQPADLFRRVAIELATSRWGDYFDVITVGDVPDFAGFERNRKFPTVGEALDALAATAREIDESLTALGANAAVAPRVTFALGDGWTPSIFVTHQPLAAIDEERLRSIVGEGGRGVGALLGGARGSWTLAMSDGGAHLDPLGIELVPLAMPEVHAAAIEELLADAAAGHLSADDLRDAARSTKVPSPSDESELLTDERSPVALNEDDEILDSADLTGDSPAIVKSTVVSGDEGAVVPAVPMVRVLGAVGIDNIDHEGRRKVIELIVFLALHPDGVSADRLTEALWPDAAPDPRTLTRNVCYARKALGLDVDGNNHLPRINTAGRYRLGPHVRCDLLELMRLAKEARETDDPAVRIELLGTALDLVRDKPFDSIVEYEWAWTENWVALAETEIGDAAVLLAETQLAGGSSEDARRATLIGRRGAPDDARLEQIQAGWH